MHRARPTFKDSCKEMKRNKAGRVKGSWETWEGQELQRPASAGRTRSSLQLETAVTTGRCKREAKNSVQRGKMEETERCKLFVRSNSDAELINRLTCQLARTLSFVACSRPAMFSTWALHNFPVILISFGSNNTHSHTVSENILELLFANLRKVASANQNGWQILNREATECSYVRCVSISVVVVLLSGMLTICWSTRFRKAANMSAALRLPTSWHTLSQWKIIDTKSNSKCN